ncbi:MAG: cupin domain-containing protein [Deltaproteobacteria bacterium]|nr:cupin domain-containing protein [Deltaproteobacteria bacterium]
MQNVEVNLGDKLKDLRESKGLTGYQLARLAGITEARLMAFEEGYATPTIATLVKISQALGVGMGFFFQEASAPRRIEVTRADQRRPAEAHEKKGADELYYSYQSLSPTFPDKRMQPFFIEVDVVDIDSVQPASHQGEEFIFVLEGRLEWKGGGETYRLGPGDAIHFDSSIPHSIVGVGDVKPKVVAVVYQPSSSPG